MVFRRNTNGCYVCWYRSPSSGVSSLAKNYVYDYDGPSPYTAPPTKVPQFYFPITDGGVQSKELERLMSLIKTVEILTSDSGYNNLFSLTLQLWPA